MFAPLPGGFFERPTVEVARELLGKLLIRECDSGSQVARIVEVEAYLGERDAASHARRGPTARAAIMFGPPGRLYVYLIYGMHHCMNIVTETDGTAGAVLIRAAEPLSGFSFRPEARRPLSGPGKLCTGFGITLADKGQDLTRGPLLVSADAAPPPRIGVSRRVGVEYAGPWAARRLRFFIPGNLHVSGNGLK